MTEGQTSLSRMRTPPRLLARLPLVAVLITLFVSAFPGAASAAPQVVPLMDCSMENSDGTYTLVLGYRSSYGSTETIAQGRDNYATPSSYTSELPSSFEPGEQHGVAKLTVSPSGLHRDNVSWHLDGTTVTFSFGSTAACSSAQLPAFANGAALVVVLLLAATAGMVMVRHARREATLSEPAIRKGDGPQTQLQHPAEDADLLV